MKKQEISEETLRTMAETYSVSSRIEEIHSDIMSGVGATKPQYHGLYKYNTRLAAMAIAVSEGLCSELSGSSPSEWVLDQISREGNHRSKSDPKVKELATFLQLSGQLIDKCNNIVWRLS